MAEMLVQSESLTDIADEIRTLSGTTGTIGLDVMKTSVQEANNNIDTEADLISQIQDALKNKAAVTPILQSKSLVPSESSQIVTPDVGYDGLSKVTVGAIPDEYVVTSDATAVPEAIFEGLTAYVDGEKITGTMPDRNTVGKNDAVGANESYPTVAVNPTDSNLQFATNLDGVNRLMVQPPAGAYTGDSYVGIPATSLGTADASKVLSGYTFTSVSGLNVAGTMEQGVTVQRASGTCKTRSSDGMGTISCGFKPDLLFLHLNDKWYEDGEGAYYYPSATFAFNEESRTTDYMETIVSIGDNDSSNYNVYALYAELASTGATIYAYGISASWQYSTVSKTFNYVAVKYT